MTERKRTDTSPHYDLEALKRNVEKCDKNVLIFQDAIQKEYAIKAHLLQLIKGLEKEQ